jgi:hypothetical protein
MENKYYTPEIEEFHVGFECEYSDKDNTWVSHVVKEGEGLRLGNKRDYRVKYLDQEDIESLGFEVSGLGTYPEIEEYLFGVPSLMKDDGSTGNGYWLKFWKKTKKVEITDCTQVFHRRLFDGVVKNKSELKKVLKMIGYE